MRASQTKALFAASFLAAVYLCALGSHAMAQSGIVRTIPLDSEFDPAAAGALDPSAAEISADLWQGSDRAEISRLIAALPARITSPTLATLARRVLAVAANPPRGASVAPSLHETRADALLAIGQADLAARLLAGVPKAHRSESADALLLDASLMAQDNAGACAVARSRAASARDLIFAKMLTVCEALAGDTARAELGAELLAEREPNDQAFFELLDILTGIAKAPGPAVRKLQAPSPLHLTMMRAVGAPPPALPPENAEPIAGQRRTLVAMEQLIASDPAAPPLQRATAAWRALKASAGDMEAARQLFPVAGAQAPGDSVARHYAAAASANAGQEQAIALARYLLTAQAEGAHGVAAELARPMLKNLFALASGPDIAFRIARGLLFAGEPNAALQWLRSLEGARKVPGAMDAAARLAALISLAEGQDARPFDGPRAVLWNAAINQQDAATAPGKAALMAKLRQATGLQTPPSLAGAGLAYTPGTTPLELLPLQDAASNQRLGETVLRAIALIQAPGNDRDHRLADAAQALATVGLFEDARFLALEAAVEGNL